MTRPLKNALQMDKALRLPQTIGDQQIRMALASFAQQGAHLKSRGHLDVTTALLLQRQATIAADP
ncbi:MAG: hypothetical protein U9N80_05425 [Chloroflexota bacterium]|nr:hypothetical protein [Chloroflexota bacterium]